MMGQVRLRQVRLSQRCSTQRATLTTRFDLMIVACGHDPLSALLYMLLACFSRLRWFFLSGVRVGDTGLPIYDAFFLFDRRGYSRFYTFNYRILLYRSNNLVL
ncbi:hypothetical protein VTN00DRAFT_98 [Thermoascus crustaceus]|uniref:uncharacterized protein n=1 Tax=Thermoascus crustaceus TaxID=5088 RepID=UPI003742293F